MSKIRPSPIRAEYQRCANDLDDDPYLAVPGDLVDHLAGEHRSCDSDQRVDHDHDQEDQQVEAVRTGETHDPLPRAGRDLFVDD